MIEIVFQLDFKAILWASVSHQAAHHETITKYLDISHTKFHITVFQYELIFLVQTTAILGELHIFHLRYKIKGGLDILLKSLGKISSL
jgi:hypothetical protein